MTGRLARGGQRKSNEAANRNLTEAASLSEESCCVRSPPGPLTMGKDPGLGWKLRGAGNILNPRVCF